MALALRLLAAQVNTVMGTGILIRVSMSALVFIPLVEMIRVIVVVLMEPGRKL